MRDREPINRMFTAYGLGELGNEDAIQLLIKGLNDSENVVRAACARVLGDFDSPKVSEALVARQNDRDSLVRDYIAKSLEKIHKLHANDGNKE